MWVRSGSLGLIRFCTTILHTLLLPNALQLGEWMHGMAGKEVLGYMGPSPPVGIHRYILLLFKQTASGIVVDRPPARNNFNTRVFAERHSLGLPVAAVYFNAHKEPARRSWAHLLCIWNLDRVCFLHPLNFYGCYSYMLCKYLKDLNASTCYCTFKVLIWNYEQLFLYLVCVSVQNSCGV